MRVWFSFKFIIHNISFDLYINMLYSLSMSERIVYCNTRNTWRPKEGNPRINIIGASKYGKIKFLLPELSQIIFSPGPLIFKLRKIVKKF